MAKAKGKKQKGDGKARAPDTCSVLPKSVPSLGHLLKQQCWDIETLGAILANMSGVETEVNIHSVEITDVLGEVIVAKAKALAERVEDIDRRKCEGGCLDAALAEIAREEKMPGFQVTEPGGEE